MECRGCGKKTRLARRKGSGAAVVSGPGGHRLETGGCDKGRMCG